MKHMVRAIIFERDYFAFCRAGKQLSVLDKMKKTDYNGGRDCDAASRLPLISPMRAIMIVVFPGKCDQVMCAKCACSKHIEDRSVEN
jgi:hypothetical protein